MTQPIPNPITLHALRRAYSDGAHFRRHARSSPFSSFLIIMLSTVATRPHGSNGFGNHVAAPKTLLTSSGSKPEHTIKGIPRCARKLATPSLEPSFSATSKTAAARVLYSSHCRASRLEVRTSHEDRPLAALLRCPGRSEARLRRRVTVLCYE